MKKRLFIFTVIVVLCLCSLVACSDSAPQNEDALEV